MDYIFGIIYILVLASSFFWFFFRIKSFSKFSLFERLILGMGISVSVFVVLTSWYGTLMRSGFSFFVNILFYLGLAFTAFWFITLFKRRRGYKLPKFSFLEKIILVLIFIFCFKVIGLYTLNPITDPDVVASYLPFARSIFQFDHVPVRNSFTLQSMTIPPIGGPILFASYYSIVGSTLSEGFRFLTLPFFFGILIMIYLFAKKVFGKERFYALVSVLVFLSLPVIDSMLLEWRLYPDIIFSFLSLVVFYFFWFKFFDASKKMKFLLSLSIGLMVAASILLKSQGLLLLLILLFFSSVRIRFKKFRFLPLMILFAGVVPSLMCVFGFRNFGFGCLNPIYLLSYLIVLFIVANNLIKITSSEENRKSFFYILLIFLLSLLGLLWFGRNIFYYGNPISSYTPLAKSMWELRTILFPPSSGFSLSRQSFSFFSFFIFSGFGTFLILPKLVGFFEGVTKRYSVLILWFIVWYVFSDIYLGRVSSRYLFMGIAIMAILVTVGIKEIQKLVIRGVDKNKNKYFTVYFVILHSVFSLSESIFLTWSYGAKFFSQKSLRNIAYGRTSQAISNSSQAFLTKWSIANNSKVFSPITLVTGKLFSDGKIFFTSIIESFSSFLRIVNVRPLLCDYHDLISLFVIAFVVSILLIFLSCWFTKHFGKKILIVFVFGVSVMVIAPYVVIVLLISGGNIKEFSKAHEKLVYNYWGEASFVAPYLRKNKGSTSKVIFFGPPTALSYKTNMPVYNIMRGYSLSELLPVLFEKDETRIYKYFKDNNFDFVVIYKKDGMLDSFREKTILFSFFEDKNYFEKIKEEDDGILWTVYKRRELKSTQRKL